jgi:hypothetical protein
MVLTVSNQNYATGGRIAYYWSPDWGDTWVGHPSNPIIVPGTHPDGVPATGFQRTPTLLIDEKYNRYILAYNAGNDIAEPWKRRTYLAVADRPAPPEAVGDIDGDGVVGVNDFLLLLAAWGPCVDECCLADLDRDGTVAVNDFLLLLGNWG